MKILVADDFEVNRKLLRAIFTHEGFGVLEAGDGVEALQILKQEKVDAVVSDILMPNMDGYRLCAEIRRDSRLADLPFVFCTSTYTSPSDEELAMKLGADRFIRKPASASALVGAVRELTSGPRARRAIDAAALEEVAVTKEYTLQLVTKLEEKNNELHARTVALQEASAKLAAVVETVGALVVVLDRQGRIVQFNRASQELTGYSFDELKGKSVWESGLLLPEDIDALKGAFERLASGQFPSRWENSWLKKDGERRLIAWANTALLDAEGVVEYVIGTGIDITEAKRAEDAMRESERRYRRLVETLPAAVYACDAEGRITLCNEAAVVLWGRRPEIGRDLWCGSWKLFNPDGSLLPREECPMAVAIREGRSVRGQEMIVERPDGTRSYVVPYPDPIREPSGALGGAVTVLLDITERRQAEQALRKREGQLEEAQDLAHFGSWDRDIAAGKLTWSDEVYRIFGRAREEFTLSHDAFWELVHPEDRARAQDAVHEALAGGKSYNTEFRIIRPDGSARLVHSRGRVTKDNAGRPIRMFGVLQDVTERKEVEDELIKTKARLETLSRRLLETNEAELRRIARELHDEIGQSLTAAKLEIQASKRTTDPAALSLRLDDSLALVEHLLESVRELSLNLRPASLDALGMVGALRAHFTTHATRAGLTLRFETDDFSETFDPAIEMACFRVAQEALTNILRHARATSVTIELRRPDHELRLRVCDDGAGFDFAAAMARAEGGGTFGLLSMRERVELSGGVFTCVSTLGKGTEIRGSFPIARGGSASATKS